MFNNPTKIYTGGPQPGDYQILPKLQTFKYTPSFLILFAPFLALSYQDALIAFDMVQLALIPALAFFVYKIVKDKNIAIGAVAAIIILIEPLPTPPIDQAALNLLHYRFFSLNPQSFAPSYYVGYVLANAHILQTILLVGALYFGFAKKPWLSALLFAFGSFDPRASLLALPLLLWYNRQKILQFLRHLANVSVQLDSIIRGCHINHNRNNHHQQQKHKKALQISTYKKNKKVRNNTKVIRATLCAGLFTNLQVYLGIILCELLQIF